MIPAASRWSLAAFAGLITLLVAAPISRAALADSGRGESRLTPAELGFRNAVAGGTGTSGVQGIETVVLSGDPNGHGLYTIMLKVPPHTRIEAHDHPDERTATVLSGTWRFGYGDRFDERGLKDLPPGSFYTEPAGRNHFAETGESGVVVLITGIGPSGLHYSGLENGAVH